MQYMGGFLVCFFFWGGGGGGVFFTEGWVRDRVPGLHNY